jgi:hypothetical protein
MPTIHDVKTGLPVPLEPEDKHPGFNDPAFIAKYKGEYIPSFFQKNGGLELDNDLLAD